MNLSYNLAKQLKDAGFPQHQWVEFRKQDRRKGKVAYPTLSSLIEACADEFIALDRKFEGEWLAGGGRRENEYFSYQQWGKTPEEAVARLWLALNEKQVRRESHHPYLASWAALSALSL